VDKEEECDGVLLEWSKDADAAASAPVNLNAATPDIAALVTKCRDLLVASKKERDEKLAANVKSFNWDLDVWLRGLKPLEKMQWQETVEILKGLTRGGRVPSAEETTDALRGGGRRSRDDDEDGGDQGVAGMHAGIVKIHTYSFTKQKEVDAGYEIRNGKIRDSYVVKIKEMGAVAQKSGQQDLVRQLKEYLEDSTDLASWVESMLAE
jgi:hypothetical protein